MLFPIMLFLLVLTPLAVTVVHEFGDWRSRRIARPVGSLRQFRPVVGLVPAAAFQDLNLALTGAFS